MPDMNDYSNWAARKAGDTGAPNLPPPTGDGAVPGGEQEGDSEEQAMAPKEALTFAATELTEAADALEKVAGQLEDASDVTDMVADLREKITTLTEKADALEGAEEDEEDEDGEQPASE